MIISTDDLYAYGQWARDCPARLTYRSAWAIIMRDKVAGSNNKGYSMTDEKAAKIDKAVCALTKHSPRLAQVFTAHYVLGASYKNIAATYECSIASVRKNLAESSGYVIGAASMID